MNIHLEIGPWLFGFLVLFVLGWVARKPTSSPPPPQPPQPSTWKKGEPVQ